MYGVLLVFLLVGADEVEPAVRVATIKLQGAQEMAVLCEAKRDEVLALFRNGGVPEDHYLEVQRVVLDVNLKQENLRRALAIAKGGGESLVTATRIDIQRKIEQLEARRLTRVRAAHGASLVSMDVVERAVLRHQLAWIEHNFVAQLAKEGAVRPALERRRKKDVAKVRLRTADKLVVYFEKTKPGSDELFAAQVERIRALTASKLANISKR